MYQLFKPAIATLLLMSTVATSAYAGDSVQNWHERYSDNPSAALEQVRKRADSLSTFNAVIRLADRPSGPDEGPLRGVPILVKDNIETLDLPTTAGSLFLRDNTTGRDAVAVARLRGAGALIAGKTNLSEWANFRSERSSSGWSAVGGQTRNAFDITRSPCGSSSGSAVVVALGMVPAALGTETNGSVTCPASINGIVGFKPSVGLISQQGVVPISASQDTIGPMTRTVSDAALLTRLMAEQPMPQTFTPAQAGGLKLGVIEPAAAMHPEAVALLEQALADLEQAGVEIVRELGLKAYDGFSTDSYDLLLYEFRHGLNSYLSRLPDDHLNTLTLADLIQFNEDHADRELVVFDQGIREKAREKSGLDDPRYQAAKARVQATSRAAIDAALQDHGLDALVAITTAPAWKIDPVLGDHYTGGFSTYPAVAGYPHLTVPMGAVRGLPVGLSFTASAQQDWRILEIGALYEQTRTAQLARPDKALNPPDLSD